MTLMLKVQWWFVCDMYMFMAFFHEIGLHPIHELCVEFARTWVVEINNGATDAKIRQEGVDFGGANPFTGLENGVL
jgi:hypothetical protein